MSLGTIVVVGAGQAGGWAAKTLRSEGFTGRIVLVGDEAHPPHERPPLSKAVLAGTAEPDSTHLFKRDAYDELGLDIRAGVAVAAIERSSRTAVLTSGETIVYDSLILCTGSAPRKLSLPGADSPRLHYLRTIDDAILLRPRLAQGAHLIVIGAGWIGLEVAATARKRGASVTVIEPLPRICARAAPPEISEHLLHLHERHGVSFRLGVGVAAIEDTADAVVVTLSDGTSVRGDAAVAGIGIMPNVAVAQAAGLEIDNGIIVDERTQTSDPCVFAAGDVANMPLGCLGARIRLESWANAQNQAIVAAKAALRKGGALRRAALVLVGSVRPQSADARCAGALVRARGARRARRRKLHLVLSRGRKHRRRRRGKCTARAARGEAADAAAKGGAGRGPRESSDESGQAVEHVR